MSKEYEEYIEECIKLSRQCGEWWAINILEPINLVMYVLDAIESSLDSKYGTRSPEYEKMRALIEAINPILDTLGEVGFTISDIGWDLEEEFHPRPPSPESDYKADLAAISKRAQTK